MRPHSRALRAKLPHVSFRGAAALECVRVLAPLSSRAAGSSMLQIAGEPEAALAPRLLVPNRQPRRKAAQALAPTLRYSRTMPKASTPHWRGVFPAITTQMHRDGSLDLAATARHAEALIASGVSGLVFLGSLGENQMLSGEEKRLVIREMVGAVKGRVTVLSGVAESATGEAARYTRECEEAGADGVMLMPAMSYKTPDPAETLAHFRAVAQVTGLPIMIYNNPISYGNDVTPEMFAQLASVRNFVAIKESSGDTRRLTDLRNVVGDRYALFTGVDDLVFESAALGIEGWVAGAGIALPAHNQRLWELLQAGEWQKARALYRWFTPLMHLDVGVKFVQRIKLAVQECGLGKEWTRAPRLPLAGVERKAVLKVIHETIATAPKIPKQK
jgi:1-pyrroline-4-hydroxy-2-carboxylate deaminase